MPHDDGEQDHDDAGAVVEEGAADRERRLRVMRRALDLITEEATRASSSTSTTTVALAATVLEIVRRADGGGSSR